MTVSAIGIASIFARQLMQRAVAGNARGSHALERGLNIGGSFLLVLFAGLLFLGAWLASLRRSAAIRLSQS